MITSVPQADPPKLGLRIVRLFRPHRGTLAVIVGMIVTTSLLSVISALLVRRVFDAGSQARQDLSQPLNVMTGEA